MVAGAFTSLERRRRWATVSIVTLSIATLINDEILSDSLIRRLDVTRLSEKPKRDIVRSRSMRTIAFIRSALLVPVMILALPTISSAQTVSITIGPPELPVYEQPALPDQGYLWAPGYWAYGDDGYYWVPGTWVQAPEQGLLWTPGYWSWDNDGYVWNPGYWDTQVGYYGAINYGYGYNGHGYEGGYWNHGALYYNRSVNNISTTTNVTNVYNKTVINNTTTNVSYNGGP